MRFVWVEDVSAALAVGANTAITLPASIRRSRSERSGG